jgi:hypothetical protein
MFAALCIKKHKSSRQQRRASSPHHIYGVVYDPAHALKHALGLFPELIVLAFAQRVGNHRHRGAHNHSRGHAFYELSRSLHIHTSSLLFRIYIFMLETAFYKAFSSLVFDKKHKINMLFLKKNNNLSLVNKI